MLTQLSQRLHAQHSFDDAIQTVLDDVIALHGAEYGNLQLPVAEGLVIVAARGLAAPFLKTFGVVKKTDGCACGRAVRLGKPVIVTDVERDDSYAPYRAAAQRAGYRAVQSTPLLTEDGTLVGMVSTLFAQVHQPTQIEMETLRIYSVMAADHLAALAAKRTLAVHAHAMHDALYDEIAKVAAE